MNYKITAYLKDGNSRQTSYEDLLDSLGLQEEYFLADPLVKGTPSQACYVSLLLKSQFPEIVKVEIHDGEGLRIDVFGLLNELLNEKEPE